jgi:hypothetical protein
VRENRAQKVPPREVDLLETEISTSKRILAVEQVKMYADQVLVDTPRLQRGFQSLLKEMTLDPTSIPSEIGETIRLGLINTLKQQVEGLTVILMA